MANWAFFPNTPILRSCSFSYSSPTDFPVGTETGVNPRLIAERAVAPIEQRENKRRRRRAARSHHQPLPDRTPAQQWLFPGGQQKQNGQHRHDGAGHGAEDELDRKSVV